jgi:hypothetical protein
MCERHLYYRLKLQKSSAAILENNNVPAFPDLGVTISQIQVWLVDNMVYMALCDSSHRWR